MTGRQEKTGRLPAVAPQAPQGLSWRTAAASWVGLTRRNNQDSAISSPRVVGVADGMGGEAAGDLASMVAARRLWLAGADPTVHSLTGAVADAGDDIAHLVAADPELVGMGTTICAALLDDGELDIVHIGDSRAYRWRDNQLTQLTNDHSFVQQLIDQGHLTPEQARLHPKRSLVLRAVNGTAIGVPDHLHETTQVGDRYLFCSDGLSSYVDESVITDALRRPSLDDAVADMLDGASDAGAPDNVSIVCAEIVAGDDPTSGAPAKLWGAAAAMTPPAGAPPDTGDIAADLRAWGATPPPDEPVKARPTRRPARQSWPRRVAIAAVVLALLVAGAATGGVMWLRGQYFLGEVDGQVAIFQGAPYRVGPWYLSNVAETSTVKLTDLPAYYADQVRAWTIRPAGLAAAEQSVAQLHALADACIVARIDPSQTPPGEDCP